MPKMVSTKDNQWNRNHFLGESLKRKGKDSEQILDAFCGEKLTFFDDQISHDKCHRMS